MVQLKQVKHRSHICKKKLLIRIYINMNLGYIYKKNKALIQAGLTEKLYIEILKQDSTQLGT